MRFLLLPVPLLACISPLAQAALGGAPEDFSPPATPTSRQASVRVNGTADTTGTVAAAPAPFTVQEHSLPSGTVVRQYVANGTVFAVSWQGPSMPDLRRLLGDSYFTQYRQAAPASRSGRGHLHVQDPGLVVQSSGHMRAFSGKAYVPQLLPRGVDLEQLP
jgi:hypothetical protein